MGANELIFSLRNDGFSIACRDGRLQIAPAEKLTDELKQSITKCKAEILAALQIDDTRVVTVTSKPEPLPDQDGEQPDRCNRCKHVSRFVGGNACRVNNGQRWLFGFLYDVPPDQGATCIQWESAYLH